MSKAIKSIIRICQHAQRAFAEERRHRLAIEQDIFGGRVRLSTKNDDDLPSIQ